MVIATRETKRDFASLRRSQRARVLAQAGIHSGEIDGKDAGLMLLRDIVLGRRADVLDAATLLFVPVFNADGHERSGSGKRMNQRGPDNAGWRTTARNLNLNRDYVKLEAPETVALVGLIEAVDPDLYLDLHVTDGLDHQYDITYGFNEQAPWSPAASGWMARSLRPAIDRGLTAGGHTPGWFYMERDGHDPMAGLIDGRSGARLSHGYGDLRHLPTVLVENHSLKPYRRRVLGTYLLVEHALRAAGSGVADLRRAIAADRAARPGSLPVKFALDEKPSRIENFAAVTYEYFQSPISGAREVRWMGKPAVQKVPVFTMSPSIRVARPAAYWIPPARADLAAKLRLHGVRVEEVAAPVTRTLQFYRLQAPTVAPAPFEGRMMVTVEHVTTEPLERTWPAGSFRVPTDQPLGDLAMVMLEPQAEDSLFSWGYLLEVLQRTEYYENYIMEPMAQQMLERDPKLREQWQQALKDPAFAKDAAARLGWFYERSGLTDDHHLLYPVARE
ncbi:MAG: M14 family metallopeptidase [Gammaproteobacteria bacterium]|nr:M14 family metallopeptidase [Gammaproteobacteria bacterium]